MVGAGDPGRDWPRFHPGPFNGATAFESCTATVVFSMDDVAADAFELLVDVRALVGSCPHLLVTCNGQRTLAFVDPAPENRGDVITQPPLGGGTAEAVAVLPAAWLQPGRNVIDITTFELEAPAAEEMRRSQPAYAAWFGSVLEHRGLLLREAPPSALEPVAELRALPLFERRQGGAVAALADLWVCVPGGFAAAAARVSVDGAVHAVRLDLAGRSGGWLRQRIALDDAPGPRVAEVELVVDGRSTTHRGRLEAQRKWTLHLIPHVHLDVGYTDYQGKVFEVHSRNLDRATALLDENSDYAFSVDGSLTVEKFAGGRSDTALADTTAWMRAGRIAVNAFSVLFLTGLASLEECYRAAWTSADLRDRHGVPLTYANLTDVPSYSAALPSILHSLGVDWFLGIQNHTRGGNAGSGELHLRSPFRWQGVDGSEVIAYFSDQYSQLRFLCSDPPFIPALAASFTRLLRRYERADYAPADLPIVGIASDNEDLGRGEVDLVARWNRRYAYPALRYSTFPHYMRAVEHLRDALPVVRGDGGSYWEDRAGTNALMVAEYRDAQTVLPAAEALTVLTSRIDPRLRPPAERLRAAWDALLLGCEHSWSATHSITHPHEQHSVDEHAWKVHSVADARRRAQDEMHGAMSRLGELVTTDGPTYVVFNPLSWPRSALVDLQVADSTRVVASTGATVAVEHHDTVDGLHAVRLRVTDIPAFGYRTFSLVHGDAGGAGHHRGEPVDSAVVDTGRYRVTVEATTHRVTGIEHVGLGRQLVDARSRHGFGDVVHVGGGGDEVGRGAGEQRTRLFDHDLGLSAPELVLRPQAVSRHTTRRTTWGWSIVFDGEGETIPAVRTELHLFDDDDRIELDVRLRKSPSMAKESVYVAFPFAISSPALRYDRQQGWVDPAVDHHPGACNEWFTLQHAVVVDEPGLAITWSSAEAPVFTVGDVVRGTWSTKFRPPNATIFSWVMNNYWFTDCPASQEGEVLLRYAFRPAAARDDTGSARFGREHRSRAVGGDATWLDKADTGARRLPSVGASLVRLELPDSVMGSVYHPRTGCGMGIRLQELAGQNVSVDLSGVLDDGEELLACNALDDPQEAVPGACVTLSAFAVRNLAVVPGTATQHPA